MQILYGKDYQRKALDPLASGFQPEDSRRCVNAVEKFPRQPLSSRPQFRAARVGPETEPLVHPGITGASRDPGSGTEQHPPTPRRTPEHGTP